MKGWQGKKRQLFAVLAAGHLLTACATYPPQGANYNNTERGSYRGSYYEVQKGDTLYFIAYLSGRDVNELIDINQLSPPYTIFPGQKLFLWKPKYVAPQFGQKVASRPSQPIVKKPSVPPKREAIPYQPPVVVGPVAATTVATGTAAAATTVAAAKPPVISTQLSKPAQTTTAAKPVPVKSSTKDVQKSANKGVDRPSTKEYSQDSKSNKVVTTQAKPKENTAKTSKSDDGKVDTWRWPTKGRVVAGFSSRDNGNKGIDIAGQRGQDVNATAAGKVVYAGNALRGYGNLVIIKHNDDYLSAYAHNEKVLVTEQDTVTAGQKIAAMGSSGTNSVRLHFEIRYKGKSVNPLKYLPD
ncbi:peptidoglycan DD-metalloendopeptidase family protein [Photobacterium sp. 1_MG-2023]|uniref:peptidoglycan DD-metalloendopeptidase family protein n=1 Tax=Photobacterium sp. 1_MG-2023 TaxID=3062646 RepID=UPI0026E2B7AF|nr:peptidoglycan DD-metalloendopeptidase family protein [Photobacterium sp. 1_MG-2023]MDO6708004.1 peptidoglycan DD-metalloendopeptidase family protein [Photobacterium sp. 1_MG-2023]